jgi:hypothetical protein
MPKWYSCFFSFRFWQYFFMIFLNSFVYFDYAFKYGKIGKGNHSMIIRMFTSLIVGFLYAKLRYKLVYQLFILINFAVLLVSVIFLENMNPSLAQFLYRTTIVADTGAFVISFASVPKIFGIRYGCIVLCFVLVSRELSNLFVLILPRDDSKLNIVIAFACLFVGLLISIRFREKLDIKHLVAMN